ncbi:MAG: hypothetical protein ACXQS8_06615 [Candidatus Helarchaeales archaeon]
MMKSRYTIIKTIDRLRRMITQEKLKRDIDWLVPLADHKAWIEALSFALKNYDERFLRDFLLKLRMEEFSLPDRTHGDITKYDAVMRRHKMRWWREALAWVLTPESEEMRDWLRDENYL